ncbi:hypothetical protein [Paenibacillus sp. NFR01]|nr:hypothetical protein [Paenibacillus sp. NFR01]
MLRHFSDQQGLVNVEQDSDPLGSTLKGSDGDDAAGTAAPVTGGDPDA